MVLHFLVATTATTLGSMVGLGGGVIIKPVLDAVGVHGIADVGILSSITVFSMAAVAVMRQARNGFTLDRRMIVLSAGSIAGGTSGKIIFEAFTQLMRDEALAVGVQGVILALLLTLVYFRERFPSWSIKNNLLTVVVGFLLGGTASFLGIGGGPINVAVLMIFLGMDVKEAAVNSIFIILLSQLAKLTLIGMGSGFLDYNLYMLIVMVPGAVAGGLAGSSLNKMLNTRVLDRSFDTALIMIIILNLYNGYTGLIA